ncbi:hypothetical protein [Streptomyces nitrosporeus]|uniref:hypothetical protein n=1 Tax=Streptomyces nitrosporeus TaxID=28894 RepID=UPI003329C812
MSRTAEIVGARLQRLAGMKKRADGIALDDDARRREGEREEAAARTRECRARESGERWHVRRTGP